MAVMRRSANVPLTPKFHPPETFFDVFSIGSIDSSSRKTLFNDDRMDRLLSGFKIGLPFLAAEPFDGLVICDEELANPSHDEYPVLRMRGAVSRICNQGA